MEENPYLPMCIRGVKAIFVDAIRDRFDELDKGLFGVDLEERKKIIRIAAQQALTQIMEEYSGDRRGSPGLGKRYGDSIGNVEANSAGLKFRSQGSLSNIGSSVLAKVTIVGCMFWISELPSMK